MCYEILHFSTHLMIICLMILSQRKKMLNFKKPFLVYMPVIFFFLTTPPHFIFKRNVYILYILIQKIFSIFQIPLYTCVHILENQQNGAFVMRRQSYLRIPRDCQWRIQRGGGIWRYPLPPPLNFMTPRARELTLMVKNAYIR